MPQRPLIIADQNMPGLQSALAPVADLRLLPGRRISRRDLQHADALLVRSVTRVNAELLAGSRVRFVGSATIGTDHLDTTWLEQQGIAWGHAPGCNADSAAQYTLAMMILACQRRGLDITQQQVGIIGLGNVGQRVQQLLRALRVPTVANDPPRAAQGTAGLVALPEALAQPIVTLHVPLNQDGPWPTAGLINARTLTALPPGSLLINAARGGVVHEAALLQALQARHCHAALDTWPGEPQLSSALLDACIVASPHVAGYALEGKLRGSRAVLAQLAQAFHLTLDYPPLPPVTRLTFDGSDPLAAVLAATGVAQDDARLRETLKTTRDRAQAFDQLRRDYPQRREFQGLRPELHEAAEVAPFAALGFALDRA